MICGFASDITDRKIREDICQISISKFKHTLDLTAIGIALIDMQGKTLEANSALHTMLGYKDEVLSGKAVASFST